MAEHFTRFTANYCLKNTARTEKRQLEGRHLLFGVYLQTLNSLYLLNLPIDLHCWDELNIDGGQHVLTKWPVRNKRRNSILMTCHHPELGNASDWSCRAGNLLQPIRSITQIWVVTRHQYGISALVSQTSFRGKPVVASPNVGCFLRLNIIMRFLFV